MDRLMTVKQAADYLNLNFMTVYKLARRGRIPASKVGGAWRFKRDVLDAWVSDQSRLSKGRILVIDDDDKVRDLLEAVISEQGYTVSTAENGDVALAEVEKREFDMVFLDLVLPGKSGIEVFRDLKEKAKNSAVVVVTGYADAPIAMEAMSMGPLLILRKPFQVSDVVQVLNLVMKRGR